MEQVITPAVKASAYSLFIYAMKSPVTRQKYTLRLRRFFEFVGLQGAVEECCQAYVDKGIKDSQWVTEGVRRFIMMQLDRINRKEVTVSTLRNYLKAIKLFCEMNDLQVPWKKLTRGSPYGRRYADDRAPTIAELKRLIDYPDRRIKAIICTMVSSGIRLGA